MSIELNRRFAGRGTRFLIFPQDPVLASIDAPEVVWLSPPRGTVTAGPADDRIVVRDARGKPAPYDDDFGPPWTGRVGAPACPDAEGHFDHLSVDDRRFGAAHMYAVIRRVLDVWELYLGHPLPWHFAADHDRLELVPQLDWDNAQSGYGFIEAGAHPMPDGSRRPYCLNFDVLAHEIGHTLVYSMLGVPTPARMTDEYFGFQESFADVCALLAVLHFDSVVNRLLADTAGNLYMLNEVNRIAELAEHAQIRVASNAITMSDLADGWYKPHELGLPMTGAIFDVLVGIYHELLVRRGLIDPALADAAREVAPGQRIDPLAVAFEHHYRRARHGFRLALLDARDHVGMLLARTLAGCSPHDFHYVDFGDLLIDLAAIRPDDGFADLVLECFAWREIGRLAPGPWLGTRPTDSALACG